MGKVLAIEIFVTHAVDKEKENKVRNNKINMLEIDVTDIVEQMNKENFDIKKYILFDAIRWWIYKSKLEHEEEKLYEKIYNTKNYILNEKYTDTALITQRKTQIKKKEYEEKVKRQKEKEMKSKIEYAKLHPKEYEQNKKSKIIKILQEYSLKKQNPLKYVCNIPVKGEYAFECVREVWQRKIYDTFILNRDEKIITLAKIMSWVDKYSGLRVYNEFNTYEERIWNSKYDAVKQYLLELEKLEVIKSLDYKLNKWSEIKVINSDRVKANSKIIRDEKVNLVCKVCGELYEEDYINKFYIKNFNMDKECFEESIKNDN